jgi:hypothetical protein
MSIENTQKAFSRIWRIRGKYFSLHKEYDKVRVVCCTKIFADYAGNVLIYLENTQQVFKGTVLRDRFRKC